jgi:hypothetical protein
MFALHCKVYEAGSRFDIALDHAHDDRGDAGGDCLDSEWVE